MAKLLVEESESARLAARLDKTAASEDALFSSLLLETELRRLAIRTGLAQMAVTHVLDPSLYREAGLLPGRHLRSLDALHLAAALRVGAHVMVTYDQRQTDAADAAGLPVLTPWPGRTAESRPADPSLPHAANHGLATGENMPRTVTGRSGRSATGSRAGGPLNRRPIGV